MDFKLFLPLASTLVVGGTFTVFYMGYLKNKEIREKKPNIRIPNIANMLSKEDEKPQVETKVEPKGSKDQSLETAATSVPSTTTTKAQSEGSSSSPDKSPPTSAPSTTTASP